jgi:hypothetical protein
MGLVVLSALVGRIEQVSDLIDVNLLERYFYFPFLGVDLIKDLPKCSRNDAPGFYVEQGRRVSAHRVGLS